MNLYTHETLHWSLNRYSHSPIQYQIDRCPLLHGYRSAREIETHTKSTHSHSRIPQSRSLMPPIFSQFGKSQGRLVSHSKSDCYPTYGCEIICNNIGRASKRNDFMNDFIYNDHTSQRAYTCSQSSVDAVLFCRLKYHTSAATKFSLREEQTLFSLASSSDSVFLQSHENPVPTLEYSRIHDQFLRIG